MRVEIKVADADPGEEVEVVEINVEVGAEVKEGEALMEIASDKANMDLTAPIDGVLTELTVKQFDVVNADHVFGVVSDEQ
jgi:pyruvate/2-oxoglutarate dehydrogenase complex dihydrolipoamide acyltransferase (E2) component